MSKRDTIAALLRKAKDGGATEAEAAAAMQLAMKLAASSGLSLADIEADNAEAHDFIRHDIRSPKNHVHPVDSRLAASIAEFTCTKAYLSNSDAKGRTGRYTVFFGHAADVELALYIRSVCISVLEHSWGVYKYGPLAQKRHIDYKAERFSFVRAFCNRMHERMQEYRRVDAAATGTDLIVVKNQLVERRFADYLKDNGIRIGILPGKGYRAYSKLAAGAGASAASSVNLGRGVSNTARMIGKG